MANDDPYVSAARAALLRNDDVEIDDDTATSAGDGGAWVLAWLWVSDRQAGFLSHSEMLKEVLRHASNAGPLACGLDAENVRLRESQTDWLEDLLSNFSDEIDDIGSARPAGAPGAIVWVDEDGRDTWFVPSEALLHLLALARQAGLEAQVGEHCDRFCAQHGSTLDAMLTVVRLG